MKLFSMIFFTAILLTVSPAEGATTGISGDVSGTWSDDVWVDGDIRVPPGETLIIEPGVFVRFTGRFKFTVEGRLDSIGTPDDRIVLTRAYPTNESKWRGLRFDHADDASCLEYCRIEYARGDGDYPDVRGGGVWIHYCSPTVRHCVITKNYSHNGAYNGTGGGISLDESSQSIIEYNHILDNRADSGGGINVGWESDAVIRYNVIEDNYAFFAGGGIYVSANSESAIYGNVIQENTAAGWGGGGGINLWSGTIYYDTYSHVYNNLILNNVASFGADGDGGGIYSRYDTSKIYNNTLVGNQAQYGGGLFVVTFSYLRPEVYNCILWNNSAPAGKEIYLYPETGSEAEVSYCDVEGGWPGNGNIDADPLFVDAAEGDCHLLFGSPCLDVGDGSLPYLPELDFEGDPRQAIETVDMGADEFYTHLYYTGEDTPGGKVEVKMTALPGTAPVGLFLSTGVLEDPMTTKWGAWYLDFPVKGPILLSPVPSNGLILLPGTIPANAPGSYGIPMQALMGNVFTNLCLMEVE